MSCVARAALVGLSPTGDCGNVLALQVVLVQQVARDLVVPQRNRPGVSGRRLPKSFPTAFPQCPSHLASTSVF